MPRLVNESFQCASAAECDAVHVQVYRMASDDIGCSLAEAAETGLYSDYLSHAAATGKPAMHVVYINTSLKTKAEAHAVVPTITCTSSNVVQTVLQVSPSLAYVVYIPPS